MMSTTRVTIDWLQNMKQRGERIVMLTAYDYPTARILDEAGIDVLLVGDSVGNVVLGYANTLPVTMDVMLHHTAAVARAARRALVVADMPFLSYQVDAAEALRNAGRFIQEAGAHAVKLEGGETILATVERIVQAGIPVMGHLGYTPQSVHRFGTGIIRGKTVAQAKEIIKSAEMLEDAGCFSIVLECVPAELASHMREQVRIPVIGIGAGAGCDGQVLVLHDLIGLAGDFTPKFAKRYVEIGKLLREAVSCYAQEVRAGIYPGPEHGFNLPEDVAESLRQV